MRKTLALICIAFAMAVSLQGTSAQAANSSPLLGTWISTDLDGSSQSMAINGGGSGHYAMFLYDDSATTACGGAPARVIGNGSGDGDQLHMQAALTCQPGGNVFRIRLGLDFQYDPSTDTLSDLDGVVWHRS